jgi:type II secretory pathway pseudopilin PulG
MSTGLLIVLIVVAVIAVLAIGGAVATERRTRAREDDLRRDVQDAERKLAAARAGDRGWDREALEAAARQAFAARHGATPITALDLVQVADREGTEADRAVFRIETQDGAHEVVLGRRGDRWTDASG